MTRERRIHAGVLVLIGLAALNHSARADGVTGLYVGGSIGKAKISSDYAAYQDSLEAGVAGFGTLDFTDVTLQNRKTAWWFNTGYMAWPYLGIDLSYLHLGEMFNQVFGTYTPDGGTSAPVDATTRLRSQGPALGLLFRLPLLENFDVNFRVADYYARTTLTNILNYTTYTTTEQKSNGSSLLLGLGTSYSFLGHWSARVDYLYVHQAGDSATGKYSAAMLAVGAAYTF
jgi:opacity protein-like surface antigen